jgi:phage/plasmid-like protein (TIGR03299 family)
LPAEVETMVSVRETPWHKIGVVVDHALTAEEAISAAGLDWEVDLRSISVNLPNDRRAKIADRKAVVKMDTEQVLGVVGLDYKPFQNREAFSFTDNLVHGAGAKYETAGALVHNKVIFLSLHFPEQILIGGEDPHDLYLLLRTGHFGGMAISACTTMVRAVCTNTVNLGFATAKNKWSMPHTSTLEGRLQEARESLDISVKYAETFQLEAEKMMAAKVTDDEFKRVISGILPAKPRTEATIESIMNLWQSSPTNGYHGSAWGGLQAVTEYFDHGRTVRAKDAALVATLDGSVAKLRDMVSKQLMELATK